MAIIRKWQILVEKGQFRPKWQVCHQALAKYWNKMTKGASSQMAVLRKLQILRNWQIWQGFVKGLAKKFKLDNQRGLLGAGNFHENGKLEKITRIHQGFCKTSNEVAKREILTNGDYKKMANFGRKRVISAKMASMPKIHQGLCQYWNKMTKRGILKNGDFTKNYKFGKNL